MITVPLPAILGFITTITCVMTFFAMEYMSMKERVQQKKKIEDSKAIVEDELESVETSQTIRTKQEQLEYEMEMLDRRNFLITFRATKEEAEYILTEIPDSHYLCNVAEHPMDQHIIEARFTRARANTL